MGVRSIGDSRYQTRSDAKIDELARVYCSEEFMLGIYRVLAEDREFVDMLQSVWQVELSVSLLHLFRALVMLRDPIVRTDSGYHMPMSEEVIAGIRAFFDPAHLRADAVPSAVGEQRIRAEVLGLLRCTLTGTGYIDVSDNQLVLLPSIRSYIAALTGYRPGRLRGRGSAFTVPSELSDALSKVSLLPDISCMVNDAVHNTRLVHYLVAWIDLHTCLENADAGIACECPLSTSSSSSFLIKAWACRSLPWLCMTE